MKGYKELNWKTAKGMMSDPNFLRSLMEIDFDSITQGQVKNINGKWGAGRVQVRGGVSPYPCTWSRTMAVQLPLMMQGQRQPPIGPYTAQQRVWLSVAEKQELMGTRLCLCPLCGSALSLCASCQCYASIGTWGT